MRRHLRGRSIRAHILPPPAADVSALSRRFRLPVADLSTATAQAIALVPEKWARRFHVIPLSATAT
jgi:hypothetical protein